MKKKTQISDSNLVKSEKYKTKSVNEGLSISGKSELIYMKVY